jgi:hypothetical protein
MSGILKSGLSKLLKSGKEFYVSAVEIMQFPEGYFSDARDEKEKHRPFYNLLCVLTYANVPGAIRYQRTNKETRILYLTWTHQETDIHANLESLVDAVRGALPEFKIKLHTIFRGPSISESLIVARSHIIGEPLSIEDTHQFGNVMNSATEILQSLSDGIVQISFTPKRPSERTRKSLENKYRDEMERAQRTVSSSRSTLFSGEIQESMIKYDKRAEQNAQSIQIQINRMSHSHLCEVEVTAICWERDKKSAERNSKRLIDALRGSLLPADPRRALAIETKRVRPANLNKILAGVPVGKSTLLSLDEACVYLPLPTGDLGVPVADHATFHSNPADLKPTGTPTNDILHPEDVLVIGKVLDDSGRPIKDFGLIMDDLASHSGLSGDTGRGKTTTQINILLGLHRKRKNFLVLLASKNEEYVKLVRTIDSIRVFTPGDETTTPIRFSLTGYGEGVHVNSIINDIKTAIVAMMPTPGMIKEYLEALIELTFKRLGWDRDTNVRGLPLLPSDFFETLPLMEEELQYSVRGNEDFRGALFGRLRALSTSSLSRVFDTLTGVTIDELTSTPCVFLLDKLSKEERAFFVYWLVSNLGRSFEVKKKLAPVKGLRFYVVMEEAHRFLTGGSGVKVDEDHGAQRAAIDTICTSMRESRSAGLGYSLATQKPTLLNNEAFTMTLTNIVHTSSSKTDRKLLGDLMNCTDDQIQMMNSLPVGEAIVRTASSSKPVRIRIDSPIVHYPELADETPVTDTDLCSNMKLVYKKNPHFKQRLNSMKENLNIEDLDKESVLIRIDIMRVLKLYSMLKHASFKGAYNGIIETAKRGNAVIGALVIKNLAGLASQDDMKGLPFYCRHLVWLLSKTSDFKSVEMSVVSELNGILQETSPLEINHLHRRLYSEIKHRLISHTENQESLRAEINGAVHKAIEELKDHPKSISTQDQPIVTNERLDTLVPSVVMTEQFSSRYIDRVGKATEGDTKPLARMIRVFSKNIAEPEDDLESVAMKLICHARCVLKIPKDETLWNSILESVRNETSNLRSDGVA